MRTDGWARGAGRLARLARLTRAGVVGLGHCLLQRADLTLAHAEAASCQRSHGRCMRRAGLSRSSARPVTRSRDVDVGVDGHATGTTRAARTQLALCRLDCFRRAHRTRFVLLRHAWPSLLGRWPRRRGRHGAGVRVRGREKARRGVTAVAALAAARLGVAATTVPAHHPHRSADAANQAARRAHAARAPWHKARLSSSVAADMT